MERTKKVVSEANYCGNNPVIDEAIGLLICIDPGQLFCINEYFLAQYLHKYEALKINVVMPH